ncbi:hypothetical protein chiPu_0028215 [Chiloscyllium punctatum]|uniref:Uncharacterized protein n=1 Tax=Chiloscyllium punctatum TaxID=137246 RepID=A0A401TNG0_CHIPU|nr:hypothetical protein [Chiloscyllium punctatum]
MESPGTTAEIPHPTRRPHPPLTLTGPDPRDHQQCQGADGRACHRWSVPDDDGLTGWEGGQCRTYERARAVRPAGGRGVSPQDRMFISHGLLATADVSQVPLSPCR